MKTTATIIALFTLLCIDAHAQTPISISDARKQEFESTVIRVAGRVTVADQLRSTAYIQDKTAGIAVFNSTFRLGVQIGDSVVIDSATLTEFGQSTGAPGTGLTELAGTRMRFTVVPTSRIDPTPKTTTIPLVGEGVEGQLIKIRRVRFVDQGRFQGETNYSVVDQQGNDISVRIDGATDIAVNSLPIPDEQFDLIGAVSQFRGGYQIFPRFATDLGMPPVEVDTVNRNRTLDISTWNLYWYGSTDTSQGPRDKDRQRESIIRVMDSMNVDIIGVQEVLTEAALKAVADSVKPMGTYKYLFASQVPSAQKMGYIYNSSTITLQDDGLAVNGGAEAWAGGRFPYRFTFDATVDGKTRRISAFNIHAKATDSATANEDYQRRKTDAETFHAYLHDFYADAALIVLGDYNDGLTTSVIDSNLATPYLSFIDDTAEWKSSTLPLEKSGLASYVAGARSFIDHFMTSKEFSPSHYRTYLEAPQAYLSSYTATVSDHLPVTSRYWPENVTDVDEKTPVQHVARLAPNPVVDHGTIELTLHAHSDVSVELVDMLGTSTTLLKATLDPQIRLVSVPVHALSSGRYQVVVVVNGVKETLAMSVVR